MLRFALLLLFSLFVTLRLVNVVLVICLLMLRVCWGIYMFCELCFNSVVILVFEFVVFDLLFCILLVLFGCCVGVCLWILFVYSLVRLGLIAVLLLLFVALIACLLFCLCCGFDV